MTDRGTAAVRILVSKGVKFGVGDIGDAHDMRTILRPLLNYIHTIG